MDIKLLSPSDMMKHNARVLLKLIKKKNVLSRADASRMLQCSRSTASKLMSYLVGLSLVTPVGTGNHGIGRNSDLFQFNPRACSVLGVDVKPDSIQFILSDLNGQIHSRREIENTDFSPEKTVEVIHKITQEILDDSPIPEARPLGVGVMIPGWVSDDGMVLNSDPLGWKKPVRYREMLNRDSSLPYQILNDANALVLAESAFGGNGNCRNLLYIENPDDIGGAYTDSSHNLLTGENSLAMEIGKMKVNIGDQFYLVEDVLGISKIQKRWGITVQSLKDLFDSSDAETAEVCLQIADIFGQIIVQTSALLNPYAIMINTPYIKSPGALDFLKKTASLHLAETPLKETQLLLPSLERSALGGACWSILNSSFDFVIKD
ncbi:ROK family protein [Oceanispirochaeta sp.]|jgi:predicted NBD/HSP70 family sugar kinase|uniref:ROK family protein n=1 Tax=Oceanispirochaeta sp. TaxID=2035350 RepID=UPI002616B7D1|nr:ROK family protein [Oceanispirochaeta sp.]MDA3955273.1 ROK family protein [Oceanispirochaeta sp.]